MKEVFIVLVYLLQKNSKMQAFLRACEEASIIYSMLNANSKKLILRNFEVRFLSSLTSYELSLPLFAPSHLYIASPALKGEQELQSRSPSHTF